MSDFKKEQNSNNIPKLFSPRLFQTNQNKTTHNQTRSIVHTPTIMDPSLEFSKNYYSKANFQKLILRNVLTPSTPQIFSRRISMKNDKSTQISNIQSVRMPTEAFTKWRNEDKGQILFVEDGILEKEENNKAFKRFDDAMETHNSWVKSFDQEKTAKNLLFKQLEYNEKSKEVLKNTLDKFHKGSVKNLIDKVGTFQKKIIRMPPIKKKKKKIQNFLTLNKDFVGYTTIDSFEEDTINNYTFYWNILNHNLWKPTVREGATFTSYEGKIYLYGGLSNELHSELCELDIKSI